MLKPILIATATAFAAPAAFAGGFYANIEANSGFTGADYSSTTTDIHLGYEGGNDAFNYYIQGGPAVVATDGADSETRLSGKVGASVSASDQLDFYGELSVLTADADTSDDNAWSTKLGAKYSF